ncbi:MAG: hypothetical protein K1W24_11880 [Lachnospiraceae bacterium]
MGYIIRNKKNLYIKLSKNGKPVTCSKNERGVFEYQKALDILASLPKTLKRLGFWVEDISGGTNTGGQETVLNSDYIPSGSITRWIEKFGICNDILEEARKRTEELNAELSKLDRELSDILHKIELEPKKDLYKGWLVYKKIKKNREKRRMVKDELLIVSEAPRLQTDTLERQNVKKKVDGLGRRKYRIRVIEETEDGTQDK